MKSSSRFFGFVFGYAGLAAGLTSACLAFYSQPFSPRDPGVFWGTMGALTGATLAGFAAMRRRQRAPLN
jgi:hypothetical protein